MTWPGLCQWLEPQTHDSFSLSLIAFLRIKEKENWPIPVPVENMDIFVCNAITAFSQKAYHFRILEATFIRRTGRFCLPCREFGPVEELLACVCQLSHHLHPQSLLTSSALQNVHLSNVVEITCGLRRQISPPGLGATSQLCHLLCDWPQASYWNSPPQFSHL